MKKSVIFGIVFVLMVSMVFALNYIDVKETPTIVSGNGICEEYRYDFENVGDKVSVNVDGIPFEIEYAGLLTITDHDGSLYKNPKWKINGIEGEKDTGIMGIINDNNLNQGKYFDIQGDSNWDSALEEITSARIYIYERNYYPKDCIGTIKEEWTDTVIFGKKIQKEGWYLLSDRYRISHCYYASEDHLCDDDVEWEWYLNPLDQKYYSLEEIERYMDIHEEEYRLFEDQIEKDFRTYEESLPSNQDHWKFSDFDFFFDFFKKGDDPLFNFFLFMDDGPNQAIYPRWVYIGKEGVGKYLVGQMSKGNYERDLEQIGFFMFEGWNPVSVIPDFVDYSLNDLSGDCNIEKVYAWDGDRQDWDEIPSSEWSQEDLFSSQEAQGSGIVIKVTEDCRLGIIKENTPPPGLPIQ